MCGNGEGIEVLAEPIFVRAQPFNGSGSAAWRVPTMGLGFEIWEICAELYQLFLKFSRVDFMD